jgi:hypothetical protein
LWYLLWYCLKLVLPQAVLLIFVVLAFEGWWIVLQAIICYNVGQWLCWCWCCAIWHKLPQLFWSCCASGTSFLKAPLIAFEAVVVTFVLLYPIGMAVSNLDACGASGVGFSDG